MEENFSVMKVDMRNAFNMVSCQLGSPLRVCQTFSRALSMGSLVLLPTSISVAHNG